MKKKALLSVLLCIAIVFSGILYACGKTDSVKLVDFEDETVTADLGSTYIITDTFVKDTEGNNYKLTYAVKTSSGEEVTVLAGQFTVEKMEGYIITFSAQISKNDVRTRKVTVNVKDKGSPEIRFADALIGYVGENYVLPAITVTDNSGEKITPSIKVYYVDGDKETEQTITNNSFKPAQRGEYRIDATATDSSGNTGTASKSFFVRSAIADNIIEDFNDEYSISVVTNKQNGVTEEEPEYLESFEGATGVVKSSATADLYGTYEYFLFNMTTAELASLNFKKITVKCYIKYDSDAATKVQLFNWNYDLGAYNVNEWVDIDISQDIINHPDAHYSDKNVFIEGESPRDCFNRVMTSGDGDYLFWIRNPNWENDKDKQLFTLYVDEIRFELNYDPVITTPSEVKLGDEVKLDGAVNDLSDYTIEYTVTDPFGNDVSINDNAFRATILGDYKVNAKLIHATEKGETNFTIKVTSDTNIIIEDFEQQPVLGDEVVLPEGTLEGATVDVSVWWSGREISVSENKFTINNIGNYTVLYLAEKDGLTYVNSFTITVTHETRPNPLVNEVESFDHISSKDSLVGFNGRNNVDWLMDYEGEGGVAKLTYSGSNWPAFSFTQRRAMADYADYDYLVIRAYVPTGENSYKSFKLGAETGSDSYPLCGETVFKDQWYDYVFPIKAFTETWKDEGTDTSKARIWSGETNGSVEGYLYIADIYVMKKVDDLDIQMNATGDMKEGLPVTVNVTAPEGLEPIVTVYAPDGEIVELDKDGKIQETKAGKYIVKVQIAGNIYYGEKQFEFTVNSAIDFKLIGEWAESYSKGDTITICEMSLINTITDTVLVEKAGYSVSIYGKPVDVADGKFVAEIDGIYVIEYTMTYEGTPYTTTVEITIQRVDPAANEVESFDHPDSKSSLMGFNGSKNEVEWLNEYEGEQGVAKLTYKGSTWPAFSFVQRRPMADYADYDYLVVRAYVPTGENSYTYLRLGAGTSADTYPLCKETVYKDQWYDYVFPIKAFTEAWKDEGTDTGKARIWSGETSNGNIDGILYIADIFVMKKIDGLDIQMNATGDMKEGLPVTVSVTVPEGLEGIVTVCAPDGEIVQLGEGGKIESAKAGKYTVKVQIDGNIYYGEKQFEFTVSPAIDFELDGEWESYSKGDTITVLDMSLINSLTEEVLVEKMEYTVSLYGKEVTVTEGKFVAEIDGIYVIEYTTTYEGTPYTTTVEITIQRVDPVANEVESFDHPDSKDALIGINNYNLVEWLPNYEGETGVVKLTYNNDRWPVFTFVPRRQMADYNDYDYLVVRMYIAPTSGAFTGLCLGNDSSAQSYPLNSDEYATGKWIDFIYPIAPFLEWWKDEGTDTKKARIWSNQTDGSEGILYFAGIYVLKNLDDANIQMNMEGDLKAGQSITLTISAAEGFNTTISVSDPNGQPVTVAEDGIISALVEGTYKVQVEVTNEGYYGVKEFTFEVAPAIT